MSYTILKLGGSILVPTVYGPNVNFVISLRKLLTEHVAQGKKFCICIGGGRVNNAYNAALRSVTEPSDLQLDWLGIYTVRLNALFMSYALGDLAYATVIQDVDDFPDNPTASIIVCGAKEPGHSTNMDSVLFAQKCNASTIINISDIDYVYNSDPRNNLDAIKFQSVTWDTYLTFIPEYWQPKMSTPFDPIASRLAKELNIDVLFISGKSIDSLSHYLVTGTCLGTLISNNTKDITIQ